MNRIDRAWGVILIAAALAVAGAARGSDRGQVTATAQADLKWTAAAIPGVATAAVAGDMTKGASRFYLKYAAGLLTPPHHHSPDHYVTTVSGTLVLSAAGKEHRLPPGSYFALTGMASHVARCEGPEACVMFIQADGPWDVVPEPAK